MTSLQGSQSRLTFIGLLLAVALVLPTTPPRAAEPAPSGQAVMAWHVTISTSLTWSFRPAPRRPDSVRS